MPPLFPSWLRIKVLPISTRTAADAAAALGVDLGRIAKSLIFYSVMTNNPVLIIASGANWVDKEKVGKYLGFKIKTAGPDYVLEITGYPVGGVPPLNHKKPIRTLIDKDLMQYDKIWAAAGTPDSLFPISPQKLVEFTKAEVIIIKGDGSE
jgi:prolyl-tRNA editing enzyme YbaK/EbsC (Cys-tRNA(Pro) deacylase)